MYEVFGTGWIVVIVFASYYLAMDSSFTAILIQVTTSKHPTTANVILWHNTLRSNPQPIFQRHKRILSSLFSL